MLHATFRTGKGTRGGERRIREREGERSEGVAWEKVLGLGGFLHIN